MKEPEENRHQRLAGDPRSHRSRNQVLQKSTKEELFQHRDEQENLEVIQEERHSSRPARIPSSEAHRKTQRKRDRGKESKVDRSLLRHLARNAKGITESGHHTDKGPAPGRDSNEKKPAHEIEISGNIPNPSELTRKYKSDQQHRHRRILPGKRLGIPRRELTVEEDWQCRDCRQLG